MTIASSRWIAIFSTVLVLVVNECHSFSALSSATSRIRVGYAVVRPSSVFRDIELYASSGDDEAVGASSDDEASSDTEEELSNDSSDLMQTTVKVDDGGSDLTDRFKYKV